MRSKILLLRTMFYLPIAISIARILLTIVIFVWNPQDMPLRFLQIIPMLVVASYCFLYLKLFNDSTPVISLLLPTIIHIALVSVFAGAVVIIPFILPICIDIIYIIVKGIKGSSFPFEVEGESDDDSFEEGE